MFERLQNLYFFWPKNYVSMNLPIENNHTKWQRCLYEDVHYNKLNAHQWGTGFKYGLSHAMVSSAAVRSDASKLTQTLIKQYYILPCDI